MNCIQYCLQRRVIQHVLLFLPHGTQLRYDSVALNCVNSLVFYTLINLMSRNLGYLNAPFFFRMF